MENTRVAVPGPEGIEDADPGLGHDGSISGKIGDANREGRYGSMGYYSSMGLASKSIGLLRGALDKGGFDGHRSKRVPVKVIGE